MITKEALEDYKSDNFDKLKDSFKKETGKTPESHPDKFDDFCIMEYENDQEFLEYANDVQEIR